MNPILSYNNTGLPENDKIKKAYDFGVKAHVKRFDEELTVANKSIKAQLEQQFEMMKMSGQYNEEQLKELKKQQKQAMNTIRDQVEAQLLATRDVDFKSRVVEPAKAIADVDADAENVVSAILVLETVRSPKDYEALKAEVGEDVANIVAEILDMEAYPSEQSTKLSTMSDDSKRAHLAIMVGGLSSLAEMAQQLPPGQQLMMVGGRDAARQKVEFASSVRGIDSKLDDKFVEAFNEATKVVDMGVRVEVDAATNTLKAIDVDNKPPAGDGAGPSGPGLGGGFFDNDDKNTPPSQNFGGGGKKLGGGF